MFIPSVFRHRAFALLWVTRLLVTTSTVMQSVALGWLVYTVARETHDEKISMFLVGMIGLAQFVPMFFLVLYAGAAVDRYDRRKILFLCILLQIFCAASFTALSMQPKISLPLIFAVAGLFGAGRSFMMPSTASLLPLLVPTKELPRAIAYNTLSFQAGTILGPWIGGVLCAVTPTLANASSLALYAIAGVAAGFLLKMPIDTRPRVVSSSSQIKMIREGLAHLWGSKVVLGAISLDLVAVLLGGVTALLPAYARDVLHTGPEGFGHLRTAFAIGAVCTTLLLAVRPIRRHAGMWMLGGVTIYGMATVGFAVSTEASLSMLALAIAGAGDSISVFMRQNLVQLLTPDHMRGRVTAVSSLFISATNEFGEFESGIAARFMGLVGAAVFGGVGSVAVTLLWAKLFPALRKADYLVK